MSVLSFAILIYLATLIQSLKIHGKLQNQNVWNGRKELRQLDEMTLSLLLDKFEHLLQESASNDTLIDALTMAPMREESIIERLEESIKMKLPYWDYRIDARLKKPEDSSIMLMELCRNVNEETNDSLLIKNINDTKDEGEIDWQLLKIEQRCKNGALLTFLRQTLPPNNTIGKGCSSCETKSSKRWLFCDQNINRCVSKIIPNGDCTGFVNDLESCFQSKCHHGRCSQKEMITVVKSYKLSEIHPNISENISLAKDFSIYAKYHEELKILMSPLEAISLAGNFTSEADSNKIPRIDVYIAENSSILMKPSDWVISEGKYRVPEYTPIPSPKFKSLEKYYWINISSAENKQSSHASYDKKKIILPEKHSNRNRKKFRRKHFGKRRNKGEVVINKVPVQKYPESIYLIQQDNSTFRIKKLSKCGYYRKKLKQQKRASKLPKRIVDRYGHNKSPSNKDLSKFSKNDPVSAKAFKFGMKDVKLSAKEQIKTTDDKAYQFLLPTTTTLNIPPQYVFFSITVIEGKPKLNNLLNRPVAACNITLTGANMPYGFTEKIKGELIQGKTSAIIRTLNPELFGPLVEFYITVTDRNERPCKQRCLNNKGSYGNCEDRPIRLPSHEFIVFSDPIDFYETQKSLLECQWTGRGYYRKRKRDFLLFTCNE
ncbi:unnamed protein product [Onchocerca ochengi]|uniref:Uncharacterized protein n=1 Tax=Onchocerca ochengi TaxID=42157 RepID=A0A182E155_ONCOC|nr:unnamed protein product [Onchocerca ochengi]